MRITKNINATVRVVEQEYMDRKEAAKFLGTKESYVKAKNLGGELPYCRDGKKVFIRVRDLVKMVERMRVY